MVWVSLTTFLRNDTASCDVEITKSLTHMTNIFVDAVRLTSEPLGKDKSYNTFFFVSTAMITLNFTIKLTTDSESDGLVSSDIKYDRMVS